MDRVLSVPFLAPRASDPPLSARATDHAETVSSYHQPNRAIRVAIGGAIDTIEKSGSPDGGHSPVRGSTDRPASAIDDNLTRG